MAANGAAGGPHSGRDMTPAESAQRRDRMAEERVASSLSPRPLQRFRRRSAPHALLAVAAS